jgi:hypothetical protein
MEPVLVRGHIDIYDVALLEDHKRSRDTVTDDVVGRNADGLRESFVVKRRRYRSELGSTSMHKGVYLLGVHTRTDNLPYVIEYSRRDLARLAHELYLFCCLYRNAIDHRLSYLEFLALNSTMA